MVLQAELEVVTGAADIVELSRVELSAARDEGVDDGDADPVSDVAALPETVDTGCAAVGVVTTKDSSLDEVLVDDRRLVMEVACPAADEGIALLLAVELVVAVDDVEQSTVSVIVISVTVIAV